MKLSRTAITVTAEKREREKPLIFCNSKNVPACSLPLALLYYHYSEKYPGGSYVYQKELDDGLTKWTQANRTIYDADIVLWYTFGITHVSSVQQK